MYFPLFGGGGYVFVFVLVCITLCPFYFCNDLAEEERKRELVALLFLYYLCFATVNFLWLFLAVPWVGIS